MLDWRETRFMSLTWSNVGRTTTVDLGVSNGSLVASIWREKQPHWLHLMFSSLETLHSKLLLVNQGSLPNEVLDWISKIQFSPERRSWQQYTQRLFLETPDKAQYFLKIFDDLPEWFKASFVLYLYDPEWSRPSKGSSLSNVSLLRPRQARS